MKKLMDVVKIFIAVVLCVCMCACNARSESQTPQEETRDTVTESESESTGVDWDNVEQAQRVGEPSEQAPQKGVQRLTVLDFSATWCGPCRQFAPVFHEVAEEYKDQAEFRTIDIDQERDLAEQYNIQAVPTLVVLDEKGNELKRVEGAMNKGELISLIKELQ